jgi:rod shape-determining protein MreC
MHVRRSPGPGTARAARGPRSRRLLAGALVATGLVLAVGASGASGLEPVRGAAAAVLGPLERLLGPREDAVSAARAEQAALATRLAAAERAGAATSALAALLADPALAGRPVVAARVVAVGAGGPAGPERVTIDAGSRDGIEVDRTVVSVDGLVGRVVSVAPWTSDVLLVGSPDLVVGVRVGERGVLGEASGSAVPGAARPAPGLLSLGLVERGTAALADAVTTLGSVGERPYVPGIRVGTVRSVDPGVGRLAPTGTLEPAVDPTSLDVVAVVLGDSRTSPRPVVTPTAAARPGPTPTGTGSG